MTIQRFLVGLCVALVLQATVFAVYYDDLLFLRRPIDEITGQPRDVFERHAERALRRARLTVDHLDTIADGAKVFSLPAMEIGALERRATVGDADARTLLRLADAFRRTGRYDEAETIYLALLAVEGAQP